MASILVVDDEPDLRHLVRLMLEREGYEIFEAGDGTAALDAYRERPCDLVLSDLMMEPMGGATLIKRLREEFPEARYAIMTAYGENILELQQLGPVTLLKKPFRASELSDTVHTVLGAAS